MIGVDGRAAQPRPIAYAIPDGGISHVYVEAGAEAGNTGEKERLLATLARRYADWRIEGEAPIETFSTGKRPQGYTSIIPTAAT